jgi:ubiquinone/menaquinone biosynthesis C-methylase UbiE
MKNFKDTEQASDARIEATKLSLAPFAFQAAKILRDKGILKLLEEYENGIEFGKISKYIKLSEYSLGVLLDAGISIGLVIRENNKYFLTKKGYFLNNDEITKIGMDFTHDVCYQGLFSLDEAIEKNIPAGLKIFSTKNTIYEALPDLPEKAQKSWYNFDHYFSDMAFPNALPIVFKNKPKKILDIGGNTGKWAVQCVEYDKDVHITIVDHPGTIKNAEKNIKSKDLTDRISFVAMDLLDHLKPFPEGFDAVWMSQFLDCFSAKDIVSLLKRAGNSITEESIVYILETFIDRQFFENAAYFLNMTSLYFTCMANGNSRMYSAEEMKELISRSGLVLTEEIDNVSISHSLFKCKKH